MPRQLRIQYGGRYAIAKREQNGRVLTGCILCFGGLPVITELRRRKQTALQNVVKACE
jgi:hypothetical protein